MRELIDRNELRRTYDPILEQRLERLFNLRLTLPGGVEYRPPTLDEARVVYDNIVRLAAEHIDRAGFRSVTVPASGGADSTFLLKILRDASNRLEMEKGKKVKVFGFTLPCVLQADGNYYDDMGAWACELYADDYATVNIGPAHEAVFDMLFDLDAVKMRKSGRTLNETFKETSPDDPTREFKVDKGNVAARLRMIFAYGIAKMLGGAQCSTDNLSEGLTGFWTLCGDEGTFKYIQGVMKGLEQPILMYAAGIPSPFFTQKETDGLGVGDGDVSQLYGSLYTGKETYIDVDTVLLNMLGGAEYPDPLNQTVAREDHPVVRWNRRTEFKRNIFSLGRATVGLTGIPGLTFANG
jgi:NH3-dependent NAD+ synthetase